MSLTELLASAMEFAADHPELDQINDLVIVTMEEYDCTAEEAVESLKDDTLFSQLFYLVR